MTCQMNNGLTPSHLSDLVKLCIPFWAQRSQNTGLQVVPIVPLLLILQAASVSGLLSAGPTLFGCCDLIWIWIVAPLGLSMDCQLTLLFCNRRMIIDLPSLTVDESDCTSYITNLSILVGGSLLPVSFQKGFGSKERGFFTFCMLWFFIFI